MSVHGPHLDLFAVHLRWMGISKGTGDKIACLCPRDSRRSPVSMHTPSSHSSLAEEVNLLTFPLAEEGRQL